MNATIWPPAAYALPSTDEGIEAGRQEQRQLFAPDDSRQGRIARLLRIGGVTTADAYLPPL